VGASADRERGRSVALDAVAPEALGRAQRRVLVLAVTLAVDAGARRQPIMLVTGTGAMATRPTRSARRFRRFRAPGLHCELPRVHDRRRPVSVQYLVNGIRVMERRAGGRWRSSASARAGCCRAPRGPRPSA
jgi:hypothetical protein